MALPTATFDAAKSIFAGRSVIQLKLSPASTGVTAEADDDIVTFSSAHGLAVGDQLIFVSGTGFTGLTAGNTYFVHSVPASTTVKLAATSGGDAVNISLDGSAGVFQRVLVFESRKLTHNDNREFKTIERPDSAGVLRVVRKVCVKGAEEFVYEVDEAKRLVTDIFGGALSGIKEGTATIWEPDPSDASGKVALKSDVDFSCDVTRDGPLGFGDGDFTRAQLKIASRKAGDVLFTADASA